MAKWYSARYGSWNDKNGVQRVILDTYHTGTFNKSDMFNKAQEVANKLQTIVTVKEEWATGKGLTARFYEIEPML